MALACPAAAQKRAPREFSDVPALACEAAYAKPGGDTRLGFDIFDNFPYKLTRTLGRGGYGTVYRAVDAVTGEVVAVKKYRGVRDAAQEIAMFRFVRGGRGCKNMPCYRAHFVHNRVPYLVMELVNGMDGERLQAYLKRGKVMSHRQRKVHMIAIMTGTAAALDFLHGRRIVHGDIKPLNMMYDVNEKRAVLIDYGGGCMQAPNSGFVASCFREHGVVHTKHWLSSAMIHAMRKNTPLASFADIALANDVFSLALTWRYLHRASLSFWNEYVLQKTPGDYEWWVWLELLGTVDEPWEVRPSSADMHAACRKQVLTAKLQTLARAFALHPENFRVRHPSHVSHGWRKLLRGDTAKKSDTQ